MAAAAIGSKQYLINGRWVGQAEYEAYKREEAEREKWMATGAPGANYIWYQGRWMSPEERDRILMFERLGLDAMANQSSGGSVAGVGGGAPALPYAAAAVAPATVLPPSTSGVDTAHEYAKSKSGPLGNAAINALKDQMSARGMGASGLEGVLTKDILTDVARTNQGATYGAAQLAAKQGHDRALAGFTGGIQQRGQDLDYAANIFSTQQRTGQQQNPAMQYLEMARRY